MNKNARKTTVRENRNPSPLRRVVVNRFESSMTAFMSPIERWEDKNYAPRKLEHVWNYNPDGYEIITPLHGFEPQYVWVDISRGHIIILLSRDFGDDGGTSKEYYCEVPIPADANRKKAYIETTTDFLTVRLNRKGMRYKRVVAWLTALKGILSMLLGKGLNFG